jgi:hypothetical protein
MKYSLFILLITCTMCNNKRSPGKEFAGKFKGTNDGISATADLTVTSNRLRGTVIMNGQAAELEGKIDEKGSWGTVHDAATGKEYEYDGKLNNDELILSITFPELNNRVVELIMQRENTSGSRERGQKNTGDLDPDVVGTWKHTEILGGGYGSESMTNESFMEFRQDGTCSSWPGQSSGPGFYREEDRSKTSEGKWYTKENLLFFVDPATGEEASTNYAVNESGLLMSNGGNSKKIWQRVN